MIHLYQTQHPTVNAILSGDTDKVKKSIDSDKHFKERSEDYLVTACLQSRLDIVQLLLLHNATVTNDALHAAASKGATEIVSLLLDLGLDVNSEKSHALICARWRGVT